MCFNIPELKQAFLSRYPNLLNIHNWWKKLISVKYKRNYSWETDKFVLKNVLKDKYKDCVRLFSQAIDFHHHIFKANEKYGRIFMPFQCLPKTFRSAMRIKIRIRLLSNSRTV